MKFALSVFCGYVSGLTFGAVTLVPQAAVCNTPGCLTAWRVSAVVGMIVTVGTVVYLIL